MIGTSAMQEMEMVAWFHHIGSPCFYPLSHGVRQTGPLPVKVSMYYISRTWSWVKVIIWLPSPPMGLTIHVGAQVHGEPRGIC